MKNLAFALTLFSLVIFAATASADLCDHLDTNENFGSGFNGTTAVANGDSTVTITRVGAGDADANIDWRPGGDGFFSLSTESVVTLSPFADVNNNAFYDVNIL